jgi:uncharacterized protein (DUF362 family)
MKDQKTTFNRREFLRIAMTLGSAAAVSPFLNACSRAGLIQPSEPTKGGNPGLPSPIDTLNPTTTNSKEGEEMELGETPQASPTAESVSGKARVAFVKTNDRATGVRKAIELFGINALMGKSVFLKPNFNSAHPAPGSTHPEVLRELVLTLKESGAGRITVGDRSGMGDTRAIMDQIGVFNMAGELGFDTLVFDDLSPEDWVEFNLKGCHWERGFLFARPILESDAIVQACCLKTHRFGGGFTMSLKNTVGMVAKHNLSDRYNYMNELHSSQHQRIMIAETNVAYQPALIVLDGVQAFTSGGPESGELVAPGVVLAGMDRVAIDAVGVALIKKFTGLADKPVFKQDQIIRAIELELGVDSPEKIEFITGDEESASYAREIMKIMLEN